MHIKKKTILSAVLLGLFLLLLILVRTVDVNAIGPAGTAIGLSHINQAVHNALGVNMTWYHMTDGLALVAFGTAFLFATIGVLQFVRRKSLWKVDKKLFALAGLYLVMAALYLLFEVVIVNYRPIIMPGSIEPEASFPSSHTLLVCVIMGSAFLAIGDYVKALWWRRGLQVLFVLIMVLTGVGRLLSGVHWLTDILGGVLLSLSLLLAFSAVTARINDSHNGKTEDGNAS